VVDAERVVEMSLLSRASQVKEEVVSLHKGVEDYSVYGGRVIVLDDRLSVYNVGGEIIGVLSAASSIIYVNVCRYKNTRQINTRVDTTTLPRKIYT
jgi:hypothetical protein